MSFRKLIKYFALCVGLMAILGTGVFLNMQESDSLRSEPLNARALRHPRKSLPIQRPATIDRAALPIAGGQQNDSDFDLERFLERQKNSVALSKEQIDKYVEQNRHSAVSLLAAHQSSLDPSYLRRAAREYPGNTHVQLAVLLHRVLPEDRRKWIDLLTQSSPKNALAPYLSALDRFESNDVEAAISDLMEATQRPRFQHDGFDFSLFQLLKSAGKDTVEAGLAAILEVPLPHLGDLRQLSLELAGLMVQYRKSGDTNSFHAAGFICLSLANRLNEGMDSAWITSQRVRIDIETRLFQLYDPEAAPAFLRETARERLEELALETKALNDMEQLMHSRLVTATEAEQTAFISRAMRQGQLGAIRWLKP
jgi:hypothetical protein